MDVSVVIASIDSAQSIARCLSHLQRSCAGLSTELIVVDASGDGTAGRVRALGLDLPLIEHPVGTLAPQLWADGYRRSTGRVVAFTTGHCLVTPAWASALVTALDQGATGAGGPLVIGSGTRPLDWGIYFLRYAGFMPQTLGSGRIAGEIAGDNAAYTREALDRHMATFDRGFWEIDFHRLVRADGGWLTAVPDAVVEFSRSFPVRTILRHRFAHGCHFGAGRVRSGARTSWQILLAAPLVPLVLASRAARRAASGQSFPRFAASLPWVLTLAGAWALGEAWGACHRNSRTPSGQPSAD